MLCIVVIIVIVVLYGIMPITHHKPCSADQTWHHFRPTVSVITVTITKYVFPPTEQRTMPFCFRIAIWTSTRNTNKFLRPLWWGLPTKYTDWTTTSFIFSMWSVLILCTLLTATTFGIWQLGVNTWVHSHHPELTHNTVIVDCFDLPAKNGSTAYIMPIMQVK